MSMDIIFFIVLLVAMILMLVFQTRKAKKQQADRQSFWKNLGAGTEVITIGGVIGKVVEVDEEYDEIVIDSEGSLLRFSSKAISREYIRPAYVSDDDVDENGNPLVKDDENDAANPKEITTQVSERATDDDGDEIDVEETSTKSPYDED
ncbi:preprotein translocase subunit YajC [Bifidobacterium castoris]|uniref:Preprotein translocase subunit YajC n=2 Tax=Bifidobacterium castoris TaxID=2306972 RepID=A0A430FA51_9BIFI|nr:preprotein translocase subunit YajC [Bifidobacterium castoris]